MQEFGLAYAWSTADYISRSIAIALLLMSALSWSTLLIKAVRLLQLQRMAKCMKRTFWYASSFFDGVEALGTIKGNPFAELALSGHAANEHQVRQSAELQRYFDPSDWLARCLKDVLDENVARMQSGLALLASIGSTAPFIGLLGTVWGIYHALVTIGSSGEASLAKVAGPVGESLIMTAFGLFVAIPAVLGYNALARNNRAVVHQLNRFAHDLHAFFLTGARVDMQQFVAPVQSRADKDESRPILLRKAERAGA